MKEIKIYVVGHYDYKFKISSWAYYLNYKKAVLKRSGQIHEYGSEYRALLHGLYCALQDVTESCIITVYTKQKLLFDNPKKSRDKDFIVRIMTSVIKSGHIIKYEVDNKLEQVRIWEQVYGKHIGKEELKSSIEENKSSPNDVFNTHSNNILEQAKNKSGWDEIYKELYEDDDDRDVWRPGCGGY